MKKIFAACLLGSLILSAQSWAQDEALQKLIQGKKYFWEAKFSQATASLKEVAGIKNAQTEHLYEAYLYLGFAMMRQGASSTEIDAAFEQAVKLSPRREIDTTVIPPDLATRFNQVRDSMVGCTYLISDPPGMEFVVLYEDSILYSVSTPTLVCEVANRVYEVLVAEDGFEEQFMTLPMTAGKIDTLKVNLIPDQSARRGSKKMWGWVARGGIVVTAAAVIYKTALQGKNESTLENLPGPPPRP